jgi:hypothetical protein
VEGGKSKEVCERGKGDRGEARRQWVPLSERQAGRQTDSQAGRQAGRKAAGRQAGRQEERE